jgi:adenine-specific DNA-methyltransferase
LNNTEFETLNLNEKEKELVKPFYTTNELNRYWGSEKNSLWVIYTDSRFKDEKHIKPYPNLKKHLDRFRSVITSDNWPYGLHRARNEYFFKDEKIISLRKCAKPTFTFTDFECYVSQTFFVIKSNRINQKYLTAILNSKVIEFWLRYKGKMQGDLFQVDKAPLLEIPIYKSDNQRYLSQLTDFEIHNGKQGSEVSFFERIINAVVFNLYFPDHMKERGIDVMEFVERDMNEVMQGREFEKLNDAEKEQVIEALHANWSHPDNEVRNRIKLFAVRSPEILKPILES